MRSAASLLLAGSLLLLAGCTPPYTPPSRERPFRGAAEAAVTVLEYSDFQCPACKAALPTVESVLSQYASSVRFEFRHFPLRQVHPYAFNAAVAAECAADQGKFWEYHDSLYRNQPRFTRSQLVSYALELGLDEADFRGCLSSSAPADTVEVDLAEAERLQLGGTPSFFVNGQAVDNWASLSDVVGAAVAAATASSTAP